MLLNEIEMNKFGSSTKESKPTYSTYSKDSLFEFTLKENSFKRESSQEYQFTMNNFLNSNIKRNFEDNINNSNEKDILEEIPSKSIVTK